MGEEAGFITVDEARAQDSRPVILDSAASWTALSGALTAMPLEISTSLRARAAKTAGSGTVRRRQISDPPCRISPSTRILAVGSTRSNQRLGRGRPDTVSA